MQNKKRKIIISFLILLVFVSGLFVGRMWKIQSYLTDENGQVEISKVLNLYSKSRSSEVNFTDFWDLWDKVSKKYVDQPVSEGDMFYGAMEGLVAGLGDPHSVYFPPEKALQFAKDLSGEFEGIGAEIGLRDGQIAVVAPLSGSPAEKAGLLSGDKIYAIDEEDTFNMNLDEAVSQMRGPAGTDVVLTISRDNLSELKEIKITRDKITIPSVEWEMKDGNIAYLRISYFNQDTWTEFDRAVKDILKNNSKGIILDMRSNPGGYFDTAVDVASEWIPRGNIVSEQFSNDEKKDYISQGAHRFASIPTVVLIDGGTASGSEIVAGALQDYGVATIIGQTSYGKGSVQEFEVLPDGSALKITVARWYTPKDRGIDEKGVEPDFAIEEMYTDIVIGEDNGQIDYTDEGIKKALEILE